MSTITFLHPSLSTFVRKMRDPLCIITLACDLLDSDGMDAEQKEYLGMMKRAARRIGHEMNSFLAVEAGN
jgi:hypothetical protein